MKSSIIILGLAALVFTNTKAANKCNSHVIIQQELTLIVLDSAKQSVSSKVISSNDYSGDTSVFNPNSVLKASYSKTIEEVIIENKLVIENQEEIVQPLSIEMTLEDRIIEDKQITESVVSEEVYPLDFVRIKNSL